MNSSVVRISDRLSDPVPPIPAKLSPTLNSEVSHKTKPMVDKGQSSSVWIVLGFSFLTLLLGMISGLYLAGSSNLEWKGKMEQRIIGLENQRNEDKQTWDYIRTQNEVNGKALARIESALDGGRSARRR